MVIRLIVSLYIQYIHSLCMRYTYLDVHYNIMLFQYTDRSVLVFVFIFIFIYLSSVMDLFIGREILYNYIQFLNK